MDQMRNQAAVDELLLALAEEWSDPVDVFEDDLAEAMGIFRFPTLAYEDWRRIRVLGIEAETDEPDDAAT